MTLNGAKRLRVLLIAEHCNPTWTSVPLVGYHQARALAARRELDVTLVTHVNNRRVLEADPLAKAIPIHFIDNEWLARPIHQFSRFIRGGDQFAWTVATALSWPASIVFEHQAYAHFRHDLRVGHFDIVHRLTPLSPTNGSPLASLTGVPMVLGPLNGGLPWPREYPELWRREREWIMPLREAYRLLPYYRSMYQRLAAVIAGSRHTASEVPNWFHGRRYYLPENGIDPTRFPLADHWPEPDGRFRFITIGRLVPYKAVDLTLEAMAGSATLRRCELLIAGDGPERPRLEADVKRLGLEESVRFLGFVDNARLADELRRSQVFVFPSLREFGGGVVLEAMASGLPSVVVDYGGPGELAASDCSVLLPMRPRAELISLLRQAMEALASDPERCRRLSAAAVRRVREQFTWDAKAARIAQVYRDVLA
jgi:glycosyltransferase involved in cell wall biosynthesis